MIIYGGFKFKKAIVVTKKLLEELEEIILSKFNNIKYNALLDNGNSIDFNSLDEVVSYENFENNRIKHLRITANSSFNLEFNTKMSATVAYNSTVNMNFQMDNIDNCILFESKIKKLMEKNKQPWYYTVFSKTSSYHLGATFFAAWVILAAYTLITKRSSNGGSSDVTSAVNLILPIFLTIIFMIVIISKKIRDYFFPPIIFYWESEVQRSDKIQTLRTQIFWGVIVATILSILIPLFISVIY